MNTKRLFIGIKIPEYISSKLLSALQTSKDGVNWQGGVKMHITLCFLGDLTQLEQQTIVEQLSKMEKTSTFCLQLDKLGNRDTATLRILFEESESLLNLQKKIVQAINKQDLEFSGGHVTLARLSKKIDLDWITEYLSKYNHVFNDLKKEISEIAIQEFLLLSSDIKKGTYKEEAKFLLS